MVINEALLECDHCGLKYSGKQVTLLGCKSTHGNVLLPSSAKKEDFCSSQCFWNWCKKYLPEEK